MDAYDTHPCKTGLNVYTYIREFGYIVLKFDILSILVHELIGLKYIIM